MKSINVVKMLKEEENLKTKERIVEDEKVDISNKIWDYIDEYVRPIYVEKLNLSQVATTKWDKKAFELLLQVTNFTEEDKSMFNQKEQQFLTTKDKKIKKEVGQRVAEMFIRNSSIYETGEKYYFQYAVPMLEELNKQNIIIFDPEAIDNKTKLATTKIEKLTSYIIGSKVQENFNFVACKHIYETDYIEKNDIMFSDNETKKKEFCNRIKTYIVNNYNKIDYKNIENINFVDIDEFKLD